jgi:hypothetical protein
MRQAWAEKARAISCLPLLTLQLCADPVVESLTEEVIKDSKIEGDGATDL